MLFHRVYHALCVVITIVLTSWCIYEYQLDGDVTNISLRKYHETNDDFYPSITLCDKDPFRIHRCTGDVAWCENKHSEKELEVIENYKSYVLGQKRNFDDKTIKALENIDYDNETIGLSDFMSEISISILSETNENIPVTYSAIGNSLVIKEDKEFWKSTQLCPYSAY